MAKPQSISEHDAPIKTPGGSPAHTDTQSDDDKKDVKMVLDLLAEGRAAKAEIAQDWDERWDFYNDDQWTHKQPRNKSNAVLNVIKITIQSLLPILTDAQPGFNALPQEPTDFQFAQIVSKLTEAWWQNKNADHILVEVLMDCMIYDAGILKITWDPDDQFGIGDIKVDVIDPRDIYIPADARDFNRNCPWVLHVTKKQVGELKRKFPDKAHLITPDAKGKSDTEKNQSVDKVTLVSPVDQEPKVKNRFPEGQSDIRETAVVVEAWMDDEALIEYAEENTETGEIEKKVKKKYPHGKVVTVLLENKIKLSEAPNPYKHKLKPFVRFVDTILPRKFWGDGEVKPLMSIQRLLNKTLANIVDYMNFTSNPVWFIEKGSGVNHKRITNSYGLIVRLNDGGMAKIKRDIPPPLPAYIINFYNILLQASQTISGASDITQGRRPVGVTSGAAIETVQEAAHTRVRLKERNMQVSLSQMGKMIISLMMQYYTEPRVTRITGKDGWPEFFEFFVTPLEDDKVQFNKRDFTFDRENEEFIPNEKIRQGPPSKGLFDIKVLSGTSLPFAKAQRSNLAMRLAESQFIDQEELLDALEWPNKEQVLERMQQQAQGQEPPPEQ